MGIGTPLPTDFPEAAYDSVAGATQRWLASTGQGNKPPTVTYEFAGSWNAVAYRFLACHEHSDSFAQIISGPLADHRAWFEAERELFNFFFNGFSALESFYYAAHCLGAMLNPGRSSVELEKDRKRIDIGRGTSKLDTAFPGNEVSPVLNALTSSTEYQNWGKVRNVLSHRVQPPRNFFLSVGGGPTQTRVESRLPEIGRLDATTTQLRRDWLAHQMGQLINAADRFATRTFP